MTGDHLKSAYELGELELGPLLSQPEAIEGGCTRMTVSVGNLINVTSLRPPRELRNAYVGPLRFGN